MSSAYYTTHTIKENEIVKFNEYICEKITECKNKKSTLSFVHNDTKYVIKYDEKINLFQMTIINQKTKEAIVYFLIGDYQQMEKYGKYRNIVI